MLKWLEQAQYSLVLFTLFTQASVGAFWVLLVSDYLKRREPDAVQNAFTRVGTYILVPLTALGLTFSTTHLGRPQYAFRALTHVGTSWLSREVWSFSLFFALVAVYTYLWWRRVPDGEFRRNVGVFTGVVGLLGILSQAMVYVIPGRPMWNHTSTIVLFGASTLTLGPLAVAAVYSLVWGRVIDRMAGESTIRRSHRRLGITLLAGATAYVVGLTWRLSYLAAGAVSGGAVAGKAAVGKATVQTGLTLGYQVIQQNDVLLNLHIMLAAGVPLGLALALWYLHRRGASLKLCNALVIAGLALVTVGEFAGRALFYMTGRPWF